MTKVSLFTSFCCFRCSIGVSNTTKILKIPTTNCVRSVEDQKRPKNLVQFSLNAISDVSNHLLSNFFKFIHSSCLLLYKICFSMPCHVHPKPSPPPPLEFVNVSIHYVLFTVNIKSKQICAVRTEHSNSPPAYVCMYV